MLRLAGIDEVIFSIGYQPDKVRAQLGDGDSHGLGLRYVVEDSPLGTGGAVKNAEAYLDDRTVILNGDVLTDVNLARVVSEHVAAGAATTIVLTPVSNPAAYGLVEFDATGRVTKFVEKPDPSQISTDTINAGIYVIDTTALELIPAGEKHSLERQFFPRLLQDGALVQAHVHRGYWIDIGTPAKYLQVHRDILTGAFRIDIRAEASRGGWIHRRARVDHAAHLEAPFYIGPDCVIAAGARIGPHVALGDGVQIGSRARVRDSVVWEGSQILADAAVTGALLAPRVIVEAGAVVLAGSVLAEASHVIPDAAEPT
jgi:NDP-sugar pyrophosphorylase family protein